MKNINDEEFLKQDNDVKRIFIDWWQPSIGDLFIDMAKVDSDIDIVYCTPVNNEHFENYNGEIHYKNDSIPLFNEGQLRQFIEDKTECKLELLIDGFGQYYASLYKTMYSIIEEKQFNNLGNGALQAYWKVAIEIAKEELK